MDFDPVGLVLGAAAFLAVYVVAKSLLFGLSLGLSRELDFDQDVAAVATGQLALFFTSRARLIRVGGIRENLGFVQALARSTALAVVALAGAALIVAVAGIGVHSERDPAVSGISFVLALLLNVSIAPLAEETFFRGLLLGGLLARLPAYLAITLSSLAFSLAHIQFEMIVLHTWLGLVLGLGYARWRSLTTVVAAHSMWNLFWATEVWFG